MLNNHWGSAAVHGAFGLRTAQAVGTLKGVDVVVAQPHHYWFKVDLLQHVAKQFVRFFLETVLLFLFDLKNPIFKALGNKCTIVHEVFCAILV